MKCPYRKQTEEVDGTKSEYYMECYGTECPFYAKSVNNFTQQEYGECLRALREV